MAQPLETYQYDIVSTQSSFRVLELLPGQEGDPVSCLLLPVDWSNPLEYEAISYAWGDARDTERVICGEEELEVSRILHSGLKHLRLQDRSRFLWADAICINQSNNPERSSQVIQMLRIYQTAKAVLVWLGPDSEEKHAQCAIDSIRTIADFLCQKADISVSDLSSISNIYQEVVFKNLWFYSHSYFTRVWAVQETNANKARFLHCGHAVIEWDLVALVAGYIIMETAFSKSIGFTKAKCWWAAIMTTERIRQPKNWLFMLYLTSNFASTDSRDRIYGLRGLMNLSGGVKLLYPNYEKSNIEVYRDSIPRWDRPMLFRNPFRFGKVLPWTPAGKRKPVWSIDKSTNVLSLSGFVVDHIRYAAPYDESIFGNATIQSDKGNEHLKQILQRILATIEESQLQKPFSTSVLTATASSFSFGLDDKSDPAAERHLLHNFVAYLKLVLDDEIYNKYRPADVSDEAKHANGLEFGKPVWDFTYPESSFFLT
ncbi:heterokaryon incompatibility protein-domain-containing protein [Leptodontidium sp. MPI-SDFR-AT-0119]|nr:heterokaryon incompatibility protein-domain-containing protein [Leptodontidium sp. MPI-SDFR-AT-0119]